jgi:FkbM family methyltransferase
MQRGTQASTNLRGVAWTLTDGPSFAHAFNCYFVREEYRFETAAASPLVIDCGANLGVSVRYWKHLFPAARVIALEPDEAAFTALSENCRGLEDVRLLKKAAWTEETRIGFAVAGNDGGHLALLTEREHPVPVVAVDAVRLADLITETVHLLKLDIEGAELDVLSDCASKLLMVERMFVEFHSFVRKPQMLSRLTTIIESAGFRMYGIVEEPARQPFIERPVFNEKDFRLNLWCYRPES